MPGLPDLMVWNAHHTLTCQARLGGAGAGGIIFARLDNLPTIRHFPMSKHPARFRPRSALALARTGKKGTPWN